MNLNYTARTLQSIDDYVPYYHVRGLIQHYAAAYSYDRKDNLLLSQQSGYAKVEKFISHRKEWDKLRKDIPVKYSQALGINLEELQQAAAADREEFQQYLQMPVKPEVALFYKWVGTKAYPHAIPQHTSEKRLIYKIRSYSMQHGRICIITYPGIKRIKTYPSGHIEMFTLEPIFRIGHHWVFINPYGKAVPFKQP